MQDTCQGLTPRREGGGEQRRGRAAEQHAFDLRTKCGCCSARLMAGKRRVARRQPSRREGGGGRTRRRLYRAAPGARAWPRGASGRCRRSLPRPAHKHPRSIHHRDRPRQPARSGRRRARRAPRRAGGGAPRYFGRGELSLSTGRVVSSKCAISGDRAARPGRAEGARRRVRAAHLFDKDVRDREVRLRGSPRSAA